MAEYVGMSSLYFPGQPLQIKCSGHCIYSEHNSSKVWSTSTTISIFIKIYIFVYTDVLTGSKYLWELCKNIHSLNLTRKINQIHHMVFLIEKYSYMKQQKWKKSSNKYLFFFWYFIESFHVIQVSRLIYVLKLN